MFMKVKIISLVASAVICAFSCSLSAQTLWYNPEESFADLMLGQAFEGQERESVYHRFPKKAKDVVRSGVWNLSKSNAGESLEFTTDSKNITVRYTISGAQAMPHMPATGVSGVDLYTKDRDGSEVWLAAKYSFRDTVTFRYRSIDIVNGCDDGKQCYKLFLPLYNEVTWMEIGVDEGAQFAFEPAPSERPIVAYGTSIAQGACASRPGMAWTNILQRMLGREVVNLGFSGSALLENEVIDMLAEIDAEVYIIDAMPNVCLLEPEQIRDTVLNAVRRLRARKPETPLLLVDHLGYPHSKTDPEARGLQDKVLEMQKAAYSRLCEEGICNLYYLSYDELDFPQDGTVDGTHPSDYGMLAYAYAYRKKLMEIFSSTQ